MIHNPDQVVGLSIGMAQSKYAKSWQKLFVSGMLAGVYISIGGLLSFLVGNGIPGLAAANPILPKFLAGLTFPVGLILVSLVGADLFTGNNANLIPATLRGEVPRYYFLKNWLLVYISNFVGAFLFVYFLVHLTGLAASDPWQSAIRGIAEAKTSLPFHVALLKGIGANWLVCLAVWLGLSANDAGGRMMGLWWPVMAFVTMGFEHSIANMFYIPLGILEGADTSWLAFAWHNLVPVTIGNIIGGGLFVGYVHHYLTLTRR